MTELAVTGVTALTGSESIYPSDECVGSGVARACADATAWVEDRV